MKKQNYLLGLFISGIILLTIPFALFSQSGRGDLNWAGAWSFGPSGSVYVDNVRHLVFLGAGGSVEIIDAGDPANPEIVNTDIRTSGLVMDLWYDNDSQNLYLACGRAGFEIWDVSDYMAPVRLSHIPILYFDEETPVKHVELYNHYAILECDWGYIHTVDISDPENPQQVTFNGQMGNPSHDFHVDKDGYIHATGAQYYIRLLLHDDGSITTAGGHEFIYGSYAVFGRETEAYVSYGGSMYLLDLTLPGFPAWSITPVQFSDILVIDNMAYLVNEDGFEIWDVSNVQSPQFVASVEAPYANELYIDGNYAYVSADRNGLYILDISDPVQPEIISQIPGYGWAAASTVYDGVAYIAHSFDGLMAVDVSDPYVNGPELISTLPTNGETRDVQVKNNMVYFADWTGGLRIVDYSDPAAPDEISTIPMQAWRVALGDNNMLFVMDANPNNPDTLKIYDVSDPASPQFMSQFTFDESAWEIKYQDGYLYVAEYQSGLHILDVSDPLDPQEVASIDLPSVLDVWVQGSIAYVTSNDWDGGFVTVDISDPENPQTLQIYNPSGWFHPFYVSVSGSYAYVTLNFGEVYLFDVSDPSNVQEIGLYVTSGEAIHLFAQEGMLYVSDGPSGLQILQNDLITGIDEGFENTAQQAIISVYPNPVVDQLNFIIPEDLSNATLRIFSLTGSKVYEKDLGSPGRGNRVSVPTSVTDRFPSGTLIWECRSDGFYESGKLVK